MLPVPGLPVPGDVVAGVGPEYPGPAQAEQPKRTTNMATRTTCFHPFGSVFQDCFISSPPDCLGLHPSQTSSPLSPKSILRPGLFQRLQRVPRIEALTEGSSSPARSARTTATTPRGRAPTFGALVCIRLMTAPAPPVHRSTHLNPRQVAGEGPQAPSVLLIFD